MFGTKTVLATVSRDICERYERFAERADRCESFTEHMKLPEIHKQLWNDIYAETGLEEDHRTFFIDTDTGDIYTEDE